MEIYIIIRENTRSCGGTLFTKEGFTTDKKFVMMGLSV